MYQGAKQSRLTTGFGVSNTSADAELASSLTALRSRSRQLVRDASYAKRARTIVTNNVIGSGVGMQAQVKSVRGTLAEAVNDSIESAWEEWTYAEYCHSGGKLCFADFERAAMGQIFEAGEVIIRVHNRSFGGSKVPIGLELIESERLADEFSQIGADTPNNIRMGVEVGNFFRPVAYWIRQMHPGDIRGYVGESMKYERVPADEIYHLYIIDRWPQTRGVPWMHTAVLRMRDMDGYSEAEITAARGAANFSGTIETDDMLDPQGEVQEDGQDQITIEPGVFRKMAPGEKMNWLTPNRPNTALDPFMRYMLREIAAGVGVSYESISRDYSQSNYSSSRLALLDDRDLWKVLQLWWIRNFRKPFHTRWLGMAVMSQAIQGITISAFATDMNRYSAVLFKPRGWSWIDPTKEVEAYTMAIKAGLTTRTDVIAGTADGRDIEDIDETRERELAASKARGLVFDTDPEVFAPPEPAQPEPEPDETEDEPATEEARLRVVG